MSHQDDTDHTTPAPSTNPEGGAIARPRGRRALWWGGALILVIACAPTVIGLAVGPALVSSQLGDAFPGGACTVEGVSLGWFGSQRADGVRVSGKDGDALQLDVTVRRGLLGLILGGLDGATIDVSGTVATRILEDGSLGLQTLTGPSSDRTASVPHLTIGVGGIDIDFLTASGDHAAGFRSLRGSMTMQSSSAAIDLTGTTQVDGTTGLVKAAGSVSWEKGFGSDLTVTGTDVPIPGAGVALVMRTIDLSIKGDNLAERGEIRAQARIESPNQLPARLEADLTYGRAWETRSPTPVLAGTLTVENWPTTSLQQCAPAGVVLVDAIGPTVDLTLHAEPHADGVLSLTVASKGLSVNAEVPQGGPALRMQDADVRLSLPDGTLAVLLGDDAWKGAPAINVEANFIDLGNPFAAEWTAGAIGFEAKVTASNIGYTAFESTAATDPSLARWSTINAGWIEGRIATVALNQGISIDAAGRFQGIPIEVDAVVRGIVDGAWRVEGTHANVGPTEVGALPGVDGSIASTLARSGCNEIRAEIDIDQWTAAGGTARVSFTSGPLHGACPVTLDAASQLVIGPTTIAGTLGGSALEPWVDEGLGIEVDSITDLLADCGTVHINLGDENGGAGVVERQVEVACRVASLGVRRAPSVEGPFTISRLQVAGTIELDAAKRSTATISGQIGVPGGDIGTLRSTVGWNMGAGGLEWLSESTATLTDGGRLAGLCGAGSFAPALAGSGEIRAALQGSAEGWSARVDLSLPAVQGTVAARGAGDAIVLDGTRLRGAVSAEALAGFARAAPLLLPEQALRPIGADGAAPWSLSFDQFTLLDGQPRGDCTADLTIGAATLQFPEHPPLALASASAHVTSDDLSQGVQVAATVRAGRTPESQHSGSLEAKTTFVRGAGGGISALGATTITARAEGALADTLLDWAWNDQESTVGISAKQPLTVSAHLRGLPLEGDLANRSLNIEGSIGAIEAELTRGAPVTVGPFTFSAAARRIGTEVTATLNGSVTQGAQRSPIAAHVTAYGLAPKGSVGPTASATLSAKSARFDGHLAASAVPMRVVDALLRQHDSLAPAFGDSLNISIEALAAPANDRGSARTALDVSLSTPALSVKSPRVLLVDGHLTVVKGQPAVVKFETPTKWRDQMLSQLNPILGTITQAPPIVLTIDSLDVPLDAPRRFDADATITTGAVVLERHQQLLAMLKLAEETTTIQGLVGPLHVVVKDGQATYRDFNVGIGKFGSTWQTELVMSGDINLAADPPVAKRIRVAYPVGSLARDMAEVPLLKDVAVKFSNILQKIPIGIGEVTRIAVDFSGPLGTDKPLEMSVRPEVDLGKAIDFDSIFK